MDGKFFKQVLNSQNADLERQMEAAKNSRINQHNADYSALVDQGVKCEDFDKQDQVLLHLGVLEL